MFQMGKMYLLRIPLHFDWLGLKGRSGLPGSRAALGEEFGAAGPLHQLEGPQLLKPPVAELGFGRAF